MRNYRWFINIDHVEDSDLEFMGWYRVVEGPEFSIYRRPHDGEEQMVSNDPPRIIVVDDYNDAQILSRGSIIIGPENH